MQGNDKAITTLVRSMKRTLKDNHGIDVPHSALRASYLQALGENPHAFAGREKAVETKMEAVTPAAVEQSGHRTWRTLYLAPDDIGCLERLALDKEGIIRLPEDFEFQNAVLERQFAEVPRVSRYGLPDYLTKAKEFYAPLGITLANTYAFWHSDLGDDSGDQCKLLVSMSDAEWNAALKVALEANPSFESDVAEWVGLHYHRSFETEPTGKQLDWVERYLGSLAESETLFDDGSDDEPESAKVDVRFEWAYQNDQTGSVEAYIELDTGLVVFAHEVPDDVSHPSVKAFVRVPLKGGTLENMLSGEVYPAYYERNFAGGGHFKIGCDAITQIAEEHELLVFRR